MKTFLTVMVFTCISCFALNAEEQMGKTAQKDMAAPKKEMPAKAPQMFCAAEKDKTTVPAKEAEKDSCKQMKAKFLAAKEESKSEDVKKESRPLVAMKDEAAKKDMPMPANVKKEEEKKALPSKTVFAAAATTTDEKTMKDEKSMKPMPQKLA